MNSNWSYNLETLNSGLNWWFLCPSSFVHCFKALGEFKLKLQSRNTQFGSKSTIFWLMWPWNLTDDLDKLQGTSLLRQALCIISKPWVNSNWSYSPEMPNLGHNWWLLSRVTLKFDGWPWKTIEHVFHAASSLVHHFIAISKFNLELQSGKAQFWSKSMIVFGVSDLEIWWMTLRNNGAPLLCYFKLCAPFIDIGEFKLELQSGNAQFG